MPAGQYDYFVIQFVLREFLDHLLGQGTIYPDTIETGGTKRSDTIKTHHNRVPIITRMMESGRVVRGWRKAGFMRRVRRWV